MKKITQKFLLIRISDGRSAGYVLKSAKERKWLGNHKNSRIVGDIEIPIDTVAMLKNFGIQRLVDRVAMAVEKDHIKMSFVSDVL